MHSPLHAPAHTTALGTTIHAYAAAAALDRRVAFRCHAAYASIFANGALPLLVDPRRTLLPPAFRGPVHGEHVRDTMARAVGATRAPGLALPSATPRRSGRVALCPHAAEAFKEWRPERWCALAEALLGQGMTVLAYPAPRRETLAWPHGVVEETLDLSGLAEGLAGASAVIAVDSGPAHLGDLFATPVVGLYAATSAVTYGPYGSRAHCVDRHREAFPAGGTYDTARHVHGNPMDAVTVGAVLSHVDVALGNPP